ncbi:hypothetical protein LZ30DRAFT_202960 [Colletotrichum cereale]|nr:hypothetical protein LZ30DRAFT_202960 [Colletotrichum cereale]
MLRSSYLDTTAYTYTCIPYTTPISPLAAGIPGALTLHSVRSLLLLLPVGSGLVFGRGTVELNETPPLPSDRRASRPRPVTSHGNDDSNPLRASQVVFDSPTRYRDTGPGGGIRQAIPNPTLPLWTLGRGLASGKNKQRATLPEGTTGPTRGTRGLEFRSRDGRPIYPNLT